jgi:hypothetical protein
MKNQYFGDVNDFRKYGLIRGLTGFIDSKIKYNKRTELSLAVCWMLTPDDNLPHGNRTEYLIQPTPNVYSNIDYDLYQYLCSLDIVNGNNRDVKNARHKKCLAPNSFFYSDYIPNGKHERAEYFCKFLKQAEEFDIIFFDPDNGMNVISHPYGTKYSIKYLYSFELSNSYWCGHSIVLYQHFGMQPGGRELFIKNMANDLKRNVCIEEIYSFKSSHVVFFLLPQAKHRDFIKKRIEYIREKWPHSQFSEIINH